jgi:hypothetical protein
VRNGEWGHPMLQKGAERLNSRHNRAAHDWLLNRFSFFTSHFQIPVLNGFLVTVLTENILESLSP